MPLLPNWCYYKEWLQHENLSKKLLFSSLPHIRIRHKSRYQYCLPRSFLTLYIYSPSCEQQSTPLPLSHYTITSFCLTSTYLHLHLHLYLILSYLTGKVSPGSSQKVVFTVRPATPSTIAESFAIQIAHFEKVSIACYCVGIFPAVVANLPRQKRFGEFWYALLGSEQMRQYYEGSVLFSWQLNWDECNVFGMNSP